MKIKFLAVIGCAVFLTGCTDGFCFDAGTGMCDYKDKYQKLKADYETLKSNPGEGNAKYAELLEENKRLREIAADSQKLKALFQPADE